MTANNIDYNDKNEKKDSPFDAMGGCQYIAIVDQCTTTVETIEIAQSHHPWELIDASLLATAILH